MDCVLVVTIHHGLYLLTWIFTPPPSLSFMLCSLVWYIHYWCSHSLVMSSFSLWCIGRQRNVLSWHHLLMEYLKLWLACQIMSKCQHVHTHLEVYPNVVPPSQLLSWLNSLCKEGLISFERESKTGINYPVVCSGLSLLLQFVWSFDCFLLSTKEEPHQN